MAEGRQYFSQLEKSLLTDLMRKHKDLVEKKRNDYKTIQQITGVQGRSEWGVRGGGVSHHPKFCLCRQEKNSCQIMSVHFEARICGGNIFKLKLRCI